MSTDIKWKAKIQPHQIIAFHVKERLSISQNHNFKTTNVQREKGGNMNI